MRKFGYNYLDWKVKDIDYYNTGGIYVFFVIDMTFDKVIRVADYSLTVCNLL